MRIENGRLVGARWVKANASGGDMPNPRFVCLHDTAGRLDKFNSVEWFASKQCGTSAHFVVEIDGTITQMVPTNKRAYHAGQSKWKGISGLNSCSIGIEIVNPGKMDNTGKAYFGKAADPSELVSMTTPSHGRGHWLPYTKEQITAVVAICRAVVEEYPDCNEIVTHYQISPGRKIDVGPQFPLEEVKRLVFDPTPAEEDLVPPVVIPPPAPPAPVLAVATEISQSKTSKGLLTLIVGWVLELLFDVGTWISGLVGSAVEVLKSTQSEANDVVAPLASLGEKLQVNTSKIAVAVTVAILVMALVRHIQKRFEASGASPSQKEPTP